MLNNLTFPGLHKAVQVLLKKTKFRQVFFLGSFHGPKHIAIWLQDSQHFSDVIWRHCMGGEPTSCDDNIIAFLPDTSGSNPTDFPPDVIPVKILCLKLPQSWHVFIQSINIDETPRLNISRYNTRPSTQIKNLSFNRKVKTKKLFANFLSRSQFSGMVALLQLQLEILELFGQLVSSESCGHVDKRDTECDCHYQGTLIDGTEFDSSYKRGKPIKFAPNQVIRGWTEAMQLMKEGDHWELYIPPDMAYGNLSSGSIPGGSTLVFELELVKVHGD